MRHRKGLRKLNKATPERMALLRALSQALFKHGKIETTLVRAKEVRKFSEKIITFAKKGDLASRRMALSRMHDEAVVKNLFQIAKEKFGSRAGGYTRITKLRRRKGDAVEIALLELLQ